MSPDDDGASDENPYERWDIDPLGGPAAITERMRELAEEAPDEPSRKAIRAAWEELTLHPARRLQAALSAHPDAHGAPGTPPPAPRTASPEEPPLGIADLALRTSVLAALGPTEEEPALLDVRYDRDPVLGD
jgi:hypothetical protein